ncbi:MAG: type II toxin-antitoxin system Phd/YefM family antitoxin [Stellaceae bacterium]
MLRAPVSVTQAKARFAALVARTEAGEEIVVCRNGRPVARLGPLPEKRPIEYGDLEGTFLAEDLSVPEAILRDFEPTD